MLAVASHVYAEQGHQLAAVDVEPWMTVEAAEALARTALVGLGADEVLILTDVFGATPCNVAQRLADGVSSRIVTGVNVPMLWRSLCYLREPLDALVTRAVAGATQGVMQVAHTRPQNQFTLRSRMIRTTLVISNKLGLHARASAKLTKLASSFECEVFMSRNGRRVNAKSIMGIMMLAAGLGSEVELETEGVDESQASEALTALVNDKFGEGQ
jgi:phosphotransferase system HPr (HPr) family protein